MRARHTEGECEEKTLSRKGGGEEEVLDGKEGEEEGRGLNL